MEFFLQQEGSLGSLIFLIALLVGLLYLILPIFAWRVWYWTRQNSKHLEDISTKLELLIRDIAPDALPPIEVPAEESAADSEEAEGDSSAEAEEDTSGFSMEDEGDFFSEEEFEGDLSDEDSMDFSMSGEFDDVSEEISDSEISDFTEDQEAEDFTSEAADEESPSGAAAETSTADDFESAAEGFEEDEDELVMDFDEDESDDESAASPSADFSEEPEEDDFVFNREPVAPPEEIPVSDSDSSDFTVEHFESNEEKSFEFEDVDDTESAADAFGEEETAHEEETPVEDSAWGDSSTDDIWGDEGTSTSAYASDDSPDGFSMGADEGDVGSAFDEPPAEPKESIGDVANSFMADLENKLNLDSLAEKPPAPPVAPARTPEPEPEPEQKPEPAPAESQATLFARCEGCGHKLAYKQALSGKRVRCPACRTAFALP